MNRKVGVVIIFVVLAIICCGACFFRDILILPSLKLDHVKSLTQKKADVVWPDYGSGAVGAVGIDGLLSSHGDQSPRPIASITKVITALVILDRKPLADDEDGPRITFTDFDLDIYNQELADGAAVKPVIAGGSMTERQALEVILLASAANYSKSLAIWAYGSMDGYLEAADKWLSSHKLNQTEVVDTSGLLSENVSTPSDLVELGKLALNNPALASIVATKQAAIPGVGTINNGNRLLGKNGVNGIKTGWTSDAGACLLFSGMKEIGGRNIAIVGVVLNGTDASQVASDVSKLLSGIQSGFHSVKLVSKGQEYGSYTSLFGRKAKLAAEKDLDAVVWSDTPIVVKVTTERKILVHKGDKVGKLKISIGGKEDSQTLLAR